MPELICRQGAAPLAYPAIHAAMRDYTHSRRPDSPDQLWLLEHQRVLTQGQAGKAEHVLWLPPDLPVVQSDRGGQVTWHGPGQLVAYLMYDLNRLGWNVRDLVTHAEQAMIGVLADHDIEAHARRDAPGVYVGAHKIGSLGFKIRQGRSYHGLALNVDNDLSDFEHINPCGHAGLHMTRMADLAAVDWPDLLAQMQMRLMAPAHRVIAGERLEPQN